MGNTSSISTVLPTSPTSGKSSSKKDRKHKHGSSNHHHSTNLAAAAAESATERAKKVLGEVSESLKSSVKKLEEQDHPAAHLVDTLCGPYFDSHHHSRHHGSGGTGGAAGGTSSKDRRKMRDARSSSFYSEDYNSDDSRTISEDEQTLDTDFNAESTINGSTVASTAVPATSGGGGGGKGKKDSTDSSYMSQSDYESEVGGAVGGGANNKSSSSRRHRKRHHQHRSSRHHRDNNNDDPSTFASDIEEDEGEDDSKTMDTTTSATTNPLQQLQQPQQLLSKPLASSFAKRCYFTKAGIGKTTQHYEGLTLTGNVVLMLAAAMKLKGCPTICDEDLRRVEQTYPNQFSRLPDELLLSSGWRRISKYCHFSNKPIPDGIPFFHSKQRLHPQGGYYFLLAAAVGMVRPIDVEPLTRDTLVLLETDYPTQCDAAPEILIQDPDEWTLVDKFCFFSGGPINTEEDVYYQADFDGNPIYMLAFLSPSLTPEELYKLDYEDEDDNGAAAHGLTSIVAVQEVEAVYDLTDRDFHDLKLYHLGPCRALPQYILQPHAWTKVLPPHFLDARHRAILRAQNYEMLHGGPITPMARDPMAMPAQQLTVGATPVDGRYGEEECYQPPNNIDGQHHHLQQHSHQYHGPSHQPHHHHPHHAGPNLSEENGYYMQPSSMNGDMNGDHGQGFASVGPDSTMAAYQHHHPEQTPHHHEEHALYQDQSPHYHHEEEPRHFDNQIQSPHEGGGSQTGSQLQYQDDDRSRQSSSFQREVEEEGAFVDTSSAPLDEAIGTRNSGGLTSYDPPKQGIDPPEHVPPPDSELDDSVVASEVISGNPNNVSNTSVSHDNYNTSVSQDNYYDTEDTLEVSKTESQYSNEMMNSPGRGDAPSYGGDQDVPPQYSYSASPEKCDEYYHHQEQSRDDQYYDSPEGLKDHQPGSQDHEFFNAPSGGGEDEEDYDPGAASSFDPRRHMVGHPDDQYSNGVGYYDDEASARLEIQESSSAEYFRGEQAESPSPIKMDHLRRLGLRPQQSPPRPSAMASPTSQASSQNSVSEYSHSSAMRGAQELLKRNRQRRHEQARRRQNANSEVRMSDSADTNGSQMKLPTQYAFAPDHDYGMDGDGSPGGGAHHRAGDDGSASTWDESANSEALASVISGSSVWTDTSSNPTDRSSRRALILQMAKARMKSNKDRDPAEKTIKEEKSGSVDDADMGYDDHSDLQQGLVEISHTDLDFAADLD